MPFVKGNVADRIEEKRQESIEFREAWDSTREEYRLIGEMISLRKKEKITQTELAQLTKNKQQVISRIENHTNTPSLRLFCNLLDAMGYEMKIVKKNIQV